MPPVELGRGKGWKTRGTGDTRDRPDMPIMPRGEGVIVVRRSRTTGVLDLEGKVINEQVRQKTGT